MPTLFAVWLMRVVEMSSYAHRHQTRQESARRQATPE